MDRSGQTYPQPKVISPGQLDEFESRNFTKVFTGLIYKSISVQKATLEYSPKYRNEVIIHSDITVIILIYQLSTTDRWSKNHSLLTEIPINLCVTEITLRNKQSFG